MSYDPQHPQDAGVHRFLVNSYQITREARFVIMSIPNAERTAVERAIRQLEAIRRILINLDDDFLTQDDVDEMITEVNDLLSPLEDFINTPPPHPASYLPRGYTGRPGRPAYILDIPRALCLHNLGASWARVARAMGVARQTIYSRLHELGFPTARPEFTEITDDDLDDVIAEISLQHPFDGSGIMRGHLQSRGINLPILRVQESLKRVDPLGVLSRYVPLRRYVSSCHLFSPSVGQGLSNAVCTVSEELCPCGIKMGMKNFGHGVSGFMDVSTDTPDFLSTSKFEPTRPHVLSRTSSSNMFARSVGLVELEVTTEWRTTASRG